MTRLGNRRTTHLTEEEIAAAFLELFDEGPREPSIRGLAAALEVAPAAIYHYFDNREQLVEAAMGLVWDEAIADILATVADPVNDLGPVEFFVTAGVSARRTFGRHNRLAAHLGMSTRPSARLSGVLAIGGAAFEEAGITGERAGVALYSYITYVFGSIALEASRWRMEGERDSHLSEAAPFDTRSLTPDDAPSVGDATAEAVQSVIARDAADDEALFELGLRQLVRSFIDDAS